MATIGIIVKWKPRFGVSHNEVESIPIMEKLNFILEKDLYEYEPDFDLEELPRTLLLANDACETDQCYFGIIKEEYLFLERSFAVENKGIQLLQQKWRTYYKNKINFFRNVRNLQHRQVYGKFPKNKFH